MEEEEDFQIFLNKKTVFDIREKGGENVLHAIFLENLSKEFYLQDKNKNKLISSVKQKEFDGYTWHKSLKVSLAVLKRYKMFHTISTIESEFGLLPHRTGFRNGKQLDKYFDDLLYARNPQNTNKKHRHRHHHHQKTPPELLNRPLNEGSSQSSYSNKKNKTSNSSYSSMNHEKENEIKNENNESFNQSDFLFTPSNSPTKVKDGAVIDSPKNQTDSNYIKVFQELLSSSDSQKSNNSSSQNSLMNAPKLMQEVPILSENDLKELENSYISSENQYSTSSSRRKRKVKIKRNKPKKQQKEKQQITSIKGIDLNQVLSSTLDSGDASFTNENTLPLYDSNGSTQQIRKSNEVFFGSIETLSSIQLQNETSTHTFDELQNFIDDGEPSLSIDTNEGSPVFRTKARKMSNK